MQYGVLDFGLPVAVHSGTVAGPGSADFRVDSAYTVLPRPGKWRTPNLPGVRAGEPGGPLCIDFRNGKFGADVFIHGYLRQL